MLIQVDVDSTLYDSDELFHRVARDEFGVEWPTIYYNWFNAEDIGTDLETLLAIFYSSHGEKHALDNVPYEGAVDVLAGIAEDFKDVEIAYVSDRNEQQGEVLKQWLQEQGFLSNPDQHVAATKDKRIWMREVRPDIVIDDRVRTMLMARYEIGSQVVSLQHPYNMNLLNEAEGIYLVPTWKDIDTVLRDTVIPLVQEEQANEFVYRAGGVRLTL